MSRVEELYKYSGWRSEDNIMRKHKHLIKKAVIVLIIALSAFGAWRAFASHGFVTFLVDLKNVIAQTNPLLFALAVGVYLLSIPVNVLSWNAVLKAFGNAVSVIRLIPILMAGIFVNNITPMSRTGGEVVRAYGLRQRFRMPYTIAVLSVLLGRATEMIPVSLMAIIGISALVQTGVVSWHQLGIIGIIGCPVIGVSAWIIYRGRYLTGLWARVLRYLLRKEQRLNGNHNTIKEITWSASQKKAFGESLLFASALWVMALVRLKLLAYALDIDLSFSMAAAAMVWYIGVGLLAITPGGVGIIEGGLVAAFVLMGLSPSQAFALTVLERAISYLLSTGIGAVCMFALGGRQLRHAVVHRPTDK